MLRQFDNLSSWRKDNITIKAQEMYTMTFLDNKPNQFYIVNSNKSVLKIGIGNLPTADKYEYKVEQNSAEVFGRPESTSKLYILNDSYVSINITVFSVNKEFDPAVLKNMNVVLNFDDFPTVDTKINGFAEGLKLPVEIENSEPVPVNIENSEPIPVSMALEGAIPVTINNASLNTKDSQVNTQLVTANNTLNNWYSKFTYLYNELMGQYSGGLINTINAVKYSVDRVVKMFKPHTYAEQTFFLNNAIDFVHANNTSSVIVVRFNYLFNDGDIATLYRETLEGVKTPLLTIMTGEKIDSFDVYLPKDVQIYLESDEPMYRISYTVISDSMTI